MAQKSIIIIQIFKDSIELFECVKGKAISDCKHVSLPVKADNIYSDPVKVGQEIARQIASTGISARHAVVMPQPSEVLMKNLSIPPLSDASMLKSLVNSRLQRELKLLPEDMALDYCGAISSQQQNSILLAGLQKKRIYSIQSMVENANLVLDSVVPGDAAMFNGQIDSATDENIVYVDGDIAKVIVVEGGSVKYLATISSINGSQQMLAQKIAGEIKRNPVINTSKVKTFRVAAKSPEFLDLLKSHFDSEFKFTASSVSYAPIVELAGEVYFTGKGFELNFSDNHFTEKVNSKLTSNVRKAIIVCVGLLLFVGWFIYDWQEDKRIIAECNTYIAGLEETVKGSNVIIDKVNKAKQWCSSEPSYTECLLQITKEFPDQRSIWANSLALDNNFVGVMTGSATSRHTIESALDKMVGNPGFSDVKLLYIRQAGKSTTELSFAMQFKYNIN